MADSRFCIRQDCITLSMFGLQIPLKAELTVGKMENRVVLLTERLVCLFGVTGLFSARLVVMIFLVELGVCVSYVPEGVLYFADQTQRHSRHTEVS
jgi:hypothetical protein